MNITASDVKDAKLTATVTIPAADVDAAIKKAYKDTAKKYRFPGFRAGKAPRPVIDSALGAEATLAQATNDLIAANEPAVLNELDIVPTKNGDYKELDLAKDHEDYTYTVEFSLRPAAELSSFDAVEIEMPPAEVTESEINNQVEMLLNYRATFEDVEGRAVEADDYVTVDLKAVENADNFAAEGRMLIAGSDSNPKEFNEALIGANVDDVKTVTWTDEVEEGEEAETHTVEVTVKGIKVRNTPELTDELVKSDFGFDSIDAMRDAIRLEIEQDKASRLPAEKENRCVSALAERLQLDEMDADYEQSVFEELGQNFLSNLAARGMTLDTWLPASGLTMASTIMCAGVFLGVLSKSGIMEKMAIMMAGVIPASMGKFLPIIIGVLSVPLALLFDTDSYFYGLLPVLISVGNQFGVNPAHIAIAMVVCRNCATFISPVAPATYLGIGLAGVEIKDHIKYCFGWQWGVSLICLVAGLILGVITF